MLSIERLSVRYGVHEVLQGLDLRLAAGRVHGLVGRNGAGKTTLLETLYGFVRPAGGEIRYGERPLERSDVAYLPAESFFFPRITGREYLDVFASRHAGFDVEGWARVFDLPLDRLVDGYSTGMRKKLALLGTLRLGRPVVMLDEPSNGLDVESNQLLGGLVRALAAQGRTVLLTSHVLEELAGSCDEVHLLVDGTIEGSYAGREVGILRERLLSGEAGDRMEMLRTLSERLGGRG